MARISSIAAALLAGLLFTSGGARAGADQLQPGPEASMTFFAPTPSPETPLSHMRGIVTAYSVGDRYGQVEIKDADGAIWKMLIGGDMRVLGLERTCMNAPFGLDAPNEAQCPDWPRNVVLGRTVITVTFWQASIGIKPVLVASDIELARGGLRL